VAEAAENNAARQIRASHEADVGDGKPGDFFRKCHALYAFEADRKDL
jgi:hypothetical protein